MTDSAPPAAEHDLSRTLGLVRRVEMNPEGRAILEYEGGLHMCHSGGVVQGGFITGWLDAAMAHAMIARFGETIVPMSLELKVSFFGRTGSGKGQFDAAGDGPDPGRRRGESGPGGVILGWHRRRCFVYEQR